MHSTIERARQKAIDVLEACAKPQGFFASGLKGGYAAVWARDSMIASLGASLANKKFKPTFRASLMLLAKYQSPKGLIPNCVGSYNLERRSKITFNSIDAPLWFLIGHFVFASAYQDDSLLRRHQTKIAKALIWLSYQDPNEDGLIVQQPTTDWMDAFPHKYGRVIGTQALHYAALRMFGADREAERIKNIINGKIEKYLSLWRPQLGYYLPWIWKNHDGDLEHEEWFDSFGNLMAIITGMATPKIAKSILTYIEKEKINQPYPVKAIWPPIKPQDQEWKSYFAKCDARKPLEYLNAGIWPFLGGFYVAALIKTKQFSKAEQALEKLAQANLKAIKIRNLSGKYEFNEWLHGKTGQPKGEPYQAWSAGTYLYAYECCRRGRIIYF
ncbi:hypothetical protein D6821_01785 [Candidatus Parcubacteria bacterium]|nr:MAG: hypothetical protein D6821_01785 [Candidatus Parcubacteria bacterium]